MNKGCVSVQYDSSLCMSPCVRRGRGARVPAPLQSLWGPAGEAGSGPSYGHRSPDTPAHDPRCRSSACAGESVPLPIQCTAGCCHMDCSTRVRMSWRLHVTGMCTQGLYVMGTLCRVYYSDLHHTGSLHNLAPSLLKVYWSMLRLIMYMCCLYIYMYICIYLCV